jgi:hypothetical protein
VILRQLRANDVRPIGVNRALVLICVLLGALTLPAGCGDRASTVGISGTPTSAPTRSAAPSGSPSSAPPSSTPAPGAHDATAVVRDPQARLGAFAVVAEHPERRIAEWYVCRDPRCYRRTYALVVTDDDFATSHVVDVGVSHVANGWYLEQAGPDHFAISPNGGRRSLVDLSGRVASGHLSGAAGPLAGREVPLRSAKNGFAAVDPITAQAHPLSTPPDTVELIESPGGGLRAVTDGWRYLWSDDGGSSWHEIPAPPADRQLMVGLVPTTDESLQAVQVGGDGATLFPWDAVLRSTDGATWTAYDGPHRPTAYGEALAVLPDGRLVFDVEAWSDQRLHRPAARPIGLYLGSDWAHPRPVPLAGPFAGQDPHAFAPTTLDVSATSHAVTIYALTPDREHVVSTVDGGQAWQRVRAR